MTVLLQSYESFVPASLVDGIVSVGAFEHFVKPGYKPETKLAVYDSFFERCHQWLKPRGRISLQTICWGAVPLDRTAALLPLDIFPESDLPFAHEILVAAGRRFELHGIECGREDYITTLKHWLERLRVRRQKIVDRHGGEETFEYYQRYLRRDCGLRAQADDALPLCI